jgi:hypothetical protein
MNNSKADIYLKERRNRSILYFRLGMGLRQLIQRPYNNIIVLLLIYLSIKIWRSKELFFILVDIPLILLPVYKYILSGIVTLVPILLFIRFIRYLGEMASRRDEAHLIVAFTVKNLRNGHPILIKRTKIKGTNVTIREFYSNIPMKAWIETKEAIADQMNVHFVEPSIEYGGKKKNNGNRVCLYTAPSRKPTDRGDLYDDEL